MKNKCLFLLFLLLFLAAGDRETVWADTLTMTVERFSLGGSFILEPTTVEFSKGDSYADVLDREMSRQNIQYRSSTGQYGFYLEGFQGVDCGTANIPACVQQVMAGMNQTLTENKEDGLYEFSYTGQSGWMFSVNNVFPERGMENTFPSDGDAVRIMFSLAGFGADLRGSSRPTGYTDSTTGEWVEVPALDFYETADKSELIRLMGVANQNRAKWEAIEGFRDAYADAVQVMAQMDADSNDVGQAVQWLKEIQAELSQKPANPSTIPEPSITPATPVPGTTTTPAPEATVTPTPEAPTTTPDIPQESATPTPETPEESATPTPEAPEESVTPTPEAPEESTTPTPEVPGTTTTPTPEAPEEATPGQVSLSKVETAAYNRLKLTWKTVNEIDGYEIYRSTSKNGTYKIIKILDGSSTTYTDKGLDTGRFYYYKVRAYSSFNGEKIYGSYSQIKGGKPSLSSPALKVSSTNRQARLKWNKTAGANGYIIAQASAKNGKYKTVKIVKKGSTLTYTKKNLKRGKTVFYRVCAYRNVNGKRVLGAYSSPKSVKVK